MFNFDEEALGRKAFGSEGFSGSRTASILEAATARHKAAGLPGLPQEARHWLIANHLVHIGKFFAVNFGIATPKEIQQSTTELLAHLLHDDLRKEKHAAFMVIFEAIMADHKDLHKAAFEQARKNGRL